METARLFYCYYYHHLYINRLVPTYLRVSHLLCHTFLTFSGSSSSSSSSSSTTSSSSSNSSSSGREKETER